MAPTCFDVDVADKVAHVRLNRPDELNTMTAAFWRELPEIVTRISDQAIARVVVLSSTGKHFSAGMDLSVFLGDELAGETAELGRRQARMRSNAQVLQWSFTALEKARVPVLAAVQGAAWSRYLRRAMRETIDRPFMNAARVRGVSERGVLLRHALPNALGPFVTVVLLDAAMMASGAVVTESVFAWPGVGSLFTESLVKRDYPVLMAFLMCGAVTVMLLNLVADIAVRTIDPRTRSAS